MRAERGRGLFCFVLICGLLGLRGAWTAETPRQIVVTPELSDDVLINPGAGWQWIGYVPPKGEIEKMPEVSTYYTRWSWKAMEPEEGKFGGTYEVKMMDQWVEEVKKKGRYFAFRVVTYSVGEEPLVPEYVFAAGAKRFKDPNGKWVPVFWDKIFLDKMEKLVEWLGKRYASCPNLAYVDIGGGNWGEMNLRNTGVAQLDDLSLWKANGLTPETWDAMLHRMTDLYRKHFPNKLILCASDYESYGKKETPEYLMSKGVGFRDDGLGMSYCTMGRKNSAFEDNWKKVPCAYENGYLDWTSWGDASKVEPCLDWAINQTHASIVAVGKGDGALKAYEKHKDLVLKYGKKLGFRFEVKQAAFYSHPRLGQPYNVELQICNTGNVPVYFDAKAEISFVAPDGRVLAAELADAVPAIRTWMPGETIKATVSIKIPANFSTGKAQLCLGMVNAADPEQRLQLPLKNALENRRYVLGNVNVQFGGPMASSTSSAAGSPPEGSAAAPVLDAKALEAWNKKLEARVAQGIKDGQKVFAFLKIFGTSEERVKIVACDAKTLTIEQQGNKLPVAWEKLDAHSRLNLALGFLKEDQGGDLMLAAVIAQACGQDEKASEYFFKAQQCASKPDEASVGQVKTLLGIK